MADRQVYVNENALIDIADSIRAKNGSQNQYVPAQMSTAIDNLTVLKGQTKSVTPTTSSQTITPDTNYNGLTQVTVGAVTSSIDSNITAENIKKNVNILGVTGTYEGSGGGYTPKKEVIFYDYDGTKLYEYTVEQFLAFTSMPPNPTHSGLTSQGWNWTLSDAKAYLQAEKETEDNSLYIGQMYVTDDGKTRIYITLQGRLNPYLGISINGTATIDWGDNSATSTVSGTSTTTNVNTQHNYSQAGNYVITITPSSGSNILLNGSGAYGSYLLWKNETKSEKYLENRVYQNAIKKIELGNNININAYSFFYCYSLKSVTIPNSVTTINSYAFNSCYSLESVTIPNNVTKISDYAFAKSYLLSSVTIPSSVTTIINDTFDGCYILNEVSFLRDYGAACYNIYFSKTSVIIPNWIKKIYEYAFYSCYSLNSVTIPNSVTSIENYAFSNCNSLETVTIPSSVTTIGINSFASCLSLKSVTIPNSITTINSNMFASCYSLSSVTIPNNVTTIGSSAFSNCYSLESVTIPNNVTKIGSSAFYGCYGVKYYDFSNHTSVPTLSATSAFTNIPSDCKIIVPDSLYNTWKAATNWSTYASYIIKASEV